MKTFSFCMVAAVGLLTACVDAPGPDPDPGATLVIRLVDVRGEPQPFDTLTWHYADKTPDGIDTVRSGGFVRRATDGSRWAYYDSLPRAGYFSVFAVSRFFLPDDTLPDPGTGCAWTTSVSRSIPADSLRSRMTLTTRVGIGCT